VNIPFIKDENDVKKTMPKDKSDVFIPVDYAMSSLDKGQKSTRGFLFLFNFFNLFFLRKLIFRVSLRRFLMLSFLLCSVMPLFFLASWVESIVLSQRIDALKDSQIITAKAVSGALSSKLQLLSSELMNIPVADIENSVKFQSVLKKNNIVWLSSTTTDPFIKIKSDSFSVHWGDVFFQPNMSDRWLNMYAALAKSNVGDVVFSNRVLDSSGVPFIYAIYANKNDMSQVVYAAISMSFFDSLTHMFDFEDSNILTIFDTAGNTLVSSVFSGRSFPQYFQSKSSERKYFSFNDVEDLSLSAIDAINFDFLLHLKNGNSGNAQYYSNNDSIEMLAGYTPLALKVFDAERYWGVVVSKPIGYTRATVCFIYGMNCSLMVLSFLFALFISYGLTSVILRPFQSFCEIVGDYALDTKDGLSRLHEIDCSKYQGSVSFCELLVITKGVKNIAMDLSSYHEKLEAKVAERKVVLDDENEERKRIEKQLRYVYAHDSLTGLPNAYLFEDRLKSAILWSKIAHLKMAIVVVRVFDLNAVRQQYGHIVGDSMIRCLARHLRDSLTNVDMLFRSGPFEFSVLLMNVQSESHVLLVADQLHQLANDIQSYQRKGLSAPLTADVKADVGVAITQEDGEDDVASLLSKARDSSIVDFLTY